MDRVQSVGGFKKESEEREREREREREGIKRKKVTKKKTKLGF